MDQQPFEELRRRVSAVLSFLARRRIDGVFNGYSEIRRRREEVK